MKVVISSHVWATGPSQELKKYLLRKKIKMLMWIGHPLLYDERLQGSSYEVYRNGALEKESYGRIRRIPSILSYLKDFILNIFFVIRTRERYDVYFGFDNLNAFSGLILRQLGVTKKCIFYVVDYTPRRFENTALNWVYHKVESLCALHCDETWNLSWRMVEARSKFKGIAQDMCGVQREVPMGIWLDEIPRYGIQDIEKHQLVFMGHILEKHGIQHVLGAVPLITKEIPDFKFLVIGGGAYIEALKGKAHELGIEKHVEFTGYVEDHKEIDEMIARSAVAIALYETGDKEHNWTYYTDPGKLKVYLGSGIPVILTDVPHNAREIEEKRCGKIVELERESIANAILSLMKDEETLVSYRENAAAYARQFDWEIIYGEVLELDQDE